MLSAKKIKTKVNDTSQTDASELKKKKLIVHTYYQRER